MVKSERYSKTLPKVIHGKKKSKVSGKSLEIFLVEKSYEDFWKELLKQLWTKSVEEFQEVAVEEFRGKTVQRERV